MKKLTTAVVGYKDAVYNDKLLNKIHKNVRLDLNHIINKYKHTYRQCIDIIQALVLLS